MKKSKFARLEFLPAVIAIFVFAVGVRTTQAQELNIYFIDVEGGQATLLVMPDGESLLVDTGFPDDTGNARDAERIVAAAKDAGIARIDYLLITHFHADHFGGAAALSQLMAIGTFIDHDTAAPETLATAAAVERFETYKRVRATSNHIVPSVSDRLPLRGVEAVVVSTDRSTLTTPPDDSAARNGACSRDVLAAVDTYENPRSTGVLVSFGEFRFLDLGDLSGQPLSDLVCPYNRIGPVDVYLVPHHGGADVADPATLAAFQPRVAILNNGALKGGEAPIFGFLRSDDDLEDVWQLHRSEAEGAENFADERIANLDEQTAHWIRLTAKRDGSFRIRNGRTGVWRDYKLK
jgi:beta-lactamase superfamily II metal-dependent hydrolase